MLLRHTKIIQQLKKYANHFSFLFSTTRKFNVIKTHTRNNTIEKICKLNYKYNVNLVLMINV